MSVPETTSPSTVMKVMRSGSGVLRIQKAPSVSPSNTKAIAAYPPSASKSSTLIKPAERDCGVDATTTGQNVVRDGD